MKSKLNLRLRTRFFSIIILLATNSVCTAQEELTDVNTPLHLLPPDYPHPYGKTNQENIQGKLDLVLSYLEEVTPAKIIDKKTNDILPSHRLKPSMRF